MGCVYAVPVERMVASRAARAEVRVCVSVEEGDVERDAVEAEAGGAVLERLRDVVGWEWVDVREGGGMGAATGAGISGGASDVEGGRAVGVGEAGVRGMESRGSVDWRGVEVEGRVTGNGAVSEASIVVGCGGDASLGRLSPAAMADSSAPSFETSPAVDTGSCWESLCGGTDSAIGSSTPLGTGPIDSL